MQPLASIIKARSSQSPLMRGVLASLIVEKANGALIELLGEKSVDCARAVYFKNHILTVACLSSVAAQEIKLYEAKIIDEINRQVGRAMVAKIRYLA